MLVSTTTAVGFGYSGYAAPPPAFQATPCLPRAPVLGRRHATTTAVRPAWNSCRRCPWPVVALGSTSSDDEPQQQQEGGSILGLDIAPGPFKRTLGLMAIYSAILGPFLDGYHGKYGVLVYDQFPITLQVAGTQLVGTSVWVPPTFALAGVVMGGLYILLDELLQTAPADRAPSFPIVCQGIALFTFQYYLSGLLAGRLLWDYGPLNGLLAALAALCFGLFDRTKTGVIVGIATMLAGPGLELALIKWTDLYHYTTPDAIGLGLVPSFIFPVYLAGAPAVGNLARFTYQSLLGRDRRRRSGEDGEEEADA